MLSLIQFGRGRPAIPEYPQMAEDIRQAIDEVQFGVKEPKQALEKTKVFLNPEYDLKKTVENDADFLLGATFSEIIDHMNWLIYGSKTPLLAVRK
jgi:hypothetical protein